MLQDVRASTQLLTKLEREKVKKLFVSCFHVYFAALGY